MSGRPMLAVIGAAVALVLAPTSAQAQDPIAAHDRYAGIREDLLSCQLDAVWGTLTPEMASDCRRLKRRYVLYSWPGESWWYFFHCLKKRGCPPTPVGNPPADGPIPAGAHVYR